MVLAYIFFIVIFQYEKLVLTKDLEIKKVEFTTEGRKVPLQEIRKKMLEKQKPFLRHHTSEYYKSLSREEVKRQLCNLNEFSTDNEHLTTEELASKLSTLSTTRNLLVWLDNSTVANHGFLACVVTCLYDPAVFLTNAEYKLKTGKNADVQREVEQPEPHIIARCGSSDSELLLYTESRLECVKELQQNIVLDETEYTDKLRFCHGDSPLRAFEAGQQKGGTYFCSSCGIHCTMTNQLDHALRCTLVTMQIRQDKVLRGVISRRKSLQLKPKPLNGLAKKELEEELGSRGIYEGKTKAELQALLTKEMRGMQRVPALLFNNPAAPLTDIGLEQYEILPAEPLHDVGNHIENFFTEFPKHLTEEESKTMEEAIDLCLGNKDNKRTVDYRIALVKTAGFLHKSGVMSETALAALDTLIEVQRILYLAEEKRSPKEILRYHNQSWYHAILLKEIIKQPKKLTHRKMFGVYFHNISAHAGPMLRIISGQASHTENQERIFNAIKGITKTTSNYHPGQTIPNIYIRLQAEKERGREDNVGNQQSQVSHLSQCLPPPLNTSIPLSLILKHGREWQAHLEKIADFLLEGEGTWWRNDGQAIEFFDVTNSPSHETTGPPLHHFRSSTLASEELYIQNCWQRCIEENIKMPVQVLRMDMDDGSTKTWKTGFLVALVTTEKCQRNNDDKMETVVDEEQDEEISKEELEERDNLEDDVMDQEETKEQEDEQVIDMIVSPEEVVSLEDKPQGEGVLGQEDVTPPKEMHTSPQSSHGKAIEVVLGCTEQVVKFDKLHIELKNASNNQKPSNPGKHCSYKTLLARIQSQVLAEKSKASLKLKQWEHNFVIRNNLKMPSADQMKADETAGPLFKKLKYADALLKQWKIDFT